MANIVRAPMHPVDEYEAFAELVGEGMAIEDIAARYAMAEKAVRQRLALGGLSPKVRAAWRDGHLAAEAAMHFTKAAIGEQEKVLARLLKSRGRVTNWDARSAFAGKD